MKCFPLNILGLLLAFTRTLLLLSCSLFVRKMQVSTDTHFPCPNRRGPHGKKQPHGTCSRAESLPHPHLFLLSLVFLSISFILLPSFQNVLTGGSLARAKQVWLVCFWDWPAPLSQTLWPYPSSPGPPWRHFCHLGRERASHHLGPFSLHLGFKNLPCWYMKG